MYVLKRISAIILTAAILLSCCVFSATATGIPYLLELVTDFTSVDTLETTITLRNVESQNGFVYVSFELVYDTEKVVPVYLNDIETDNAVFKKLISVCPTETWESVSKLDEEKGIYHLNFMTEKNEPAKSDELVIKVPFKLKNGIADDIEFSITDDSVREYDALTKKIVGATSTGDVPCGYCGEGLTWIFLKDGNLNIDGTGDMYEGAAPWSSVADEIITVNIGKDVTGVTATAFDDCTSLKYVVTDCKVKNIRESVPADKLHYTAHTYGECKDNGNGTHQAVCEYCGMVQKSEHTFEYVINDDGTHSHICRYCDYDLTEDHVFTYTYDFLSAEKHRAYCCCGGYAEVDHTYGEYYVSLEPTETETGRYTHDCVCGYKPFIEIPVLSTENGYTYKVETEPSETDNGIAVWTHETYGEFKTIIPRYTQHEYSEWKDDGNGKHSRYCLHCGITDTFSHALENGTVVTNPTETEKGQYSTECICGYKEYSDIPVLSTENGYTYSVETEPTETEPGVAVWKHETYGEFKTVIPATSKDSLGDVLPNGIPVKNGLISLLGQELELNDLLNDDIKITDANGNEITENGLLGTGCIVSLYSGNTVIDKAVIIILGDVNGDGVIATKDYVMIKRVCIKTYELNDAFKTAADIDGDGEILTKDYVLTKRLVLGTYPVK